MDTDKTFEINEQEGSDTAGSNHQVVYDDLSRREVRSLIFHILYAAEAYNYEESLQAIVDNFNRGFDLDIPFDGELFRVAQAIVDEREALDEQIKPLLINWRFDRIGLCTKLVLRQAFWEILNTDTPPSVVINEAIELAKCFSETDAYKFVNGILDEMVKTLNGQPEQDDDEKAETGDSGS